MKKAHFIGIGGVGMSAVAKLLRDGGVEVTGSDEHLYPPVSDFLKKSGFVVLTPYCAKNIPADADTIVIGKNAKLVPETNEEVAAAYQSDKRIASFPEILGELSREKQTIVIAGSYGKSTVAALIAHILDSAGKNPSFFIGAIPHSPKESARFGKGNLFVMEGDEYPSSHRDARSKFLHLHPTHVVVTPLAHDHFNVFKTPEDYVRPFRELISLLPADGTLTICTEGPLSGEIANVPARSATTYGLRRGDFHADDVSYSEVTTFTLIHKGKQVGILHTAELGEHNVQNIVGAAAFLLQNNFVTFEDLKKAVASFKGVTRRMDRKSFKTSIPVFEGFGSSYEKAQSAIVAMKRHFGDKDLVVLFEPYTINWRRRETVSQYENVFEGAKRVYLIEPPLHGKGMDVSLEEIAERARQSVKEVTAWKEGADCAEHIRTNVQANWAVLLLSSGDMQGLIREVPRILEHKFPL